MFVRDSIRCYTSDYTVVEYKQRAYSGSASGRERLAERLERLQTAPRQQYEVDAEPAVANADEMGGQQVG